MVKPGGENLTRVDPLANFSAPTRQWFTSTLGKPTQVQVEAWEQIEKGRNALVIAPTGSGKTLAAFLHSIDHLMRTPAISPGVKVLYISPLKALGVDVEKNLRVPLAGIAEKAAGTSMDVTQISVGIRSGDTTQSQRRHLVKNPPQILITTPESLFLMLSSAAFNILKEVETVIVDEIHYLAGNKRGAHLGVSLERLQALSTRGGFQRIGLSATVRPPAIVADFLGGTQGGVHIVQPPMEKSFQLDVRVPVDDMTQLASVVPGEANSTAGADPRRTTAGSIWPYVEEEIYDLIMAHQSTICFCNSRAVAEKLSNHLNTLHDQKNPGDPGSVIARTHHGSISKALRQEIETELKEGHLPCVVATNSLELGIDMGAVDLVIQVGAPPSVASGLQRIGRGGHQVGEVSTGVLFPLNRSDLLTTCVVVAKMGRGEIENITSISNPLDILCQHLVSMCLDTPQKPDRLYEVVTQAQCFSSLPRQWFNDCVDMLTGKYPSDDFVELRPRLAWDHKAGTLSARPGARRLVTTSGGTIPDRGLYPVFLASDHETDSSPRATSRRVGELDEEMVYESRVGDVFTLGTSAWRITNITAHHVEVIPVPGQTGRMPFWKGDEALSRSAEVGKIVQETVHNLSKDPPAWEGIVDQCATIEPRAQDNLVEYIRAQRRATKELPDNSTILIERHRDEIGSWRICVHCQLGTRVLQPWAMVIQHQLRQRSDVESSSDINVVATDDGLIIRLGEIENPSIAHLLVCPTDQLDQILAEETQHSSLFAAHFRHCAARALLLPRRDPTKRSPLWQQRLRSHHLLGVASAYPNFPMIVEALRECLVDVFDITTLRKLLSDIAARKIHLVEVETPSPSPFASSMLFGYVGDFMYDPDQPLAERVHAASLVDPTLLSSLIGVGPTDQLDEQVLAEVVTGLQGLSHPASSAESLWDLIRRIGPLTEEECVQRCAEEPSTWLHELKATGRIVDIQVTGRPMVIVAEDESLFEAWPAPASVDTLVKRWVRCHGVVQPTHISARYHLDDSHVRMVLDNLVSQSHLLKGTYLDSPQPQYITQEVLARVRQRIVSNYRASIQPVEPSQFARFLGQWSQVDTPGTGEEALLAAIEHLAGYRLPFSMVDSVILPSRVANYTPAMLDHLVSTSQVTWSGHGSLGRSDGWVSLWPGDMDHLIEPAASELSDQARVILERLGSGGAWSVESLMGENPRAATLDAVWELAWAGYITSDNLSPLRALTSNRGVLKQPSIPRTRRMVRPRVVRSTSTGRWFLAPQARVNHTERFIQCTDVELNRYGILTKGSVLTEVMTSTYMDTYQVLAAMEQSGAIRRGYFVKGLGPAQFALPGAVDRLRSVSSASLILLAACDPANPWGASLAWPETYGHRPARKAGAVVILDEGNPVIYVERGAHTVVSFTNDLDQITRGLIEVGRWVDERRLDTITITTINSQSSFEVTAWAPALEQAGFVMTPSGFRRRVRVV
jgi:ATP-dependent Lhr-like helicase